MRVKQFVLDRFNIGDLSISMEGCTKEHFDELFLHLSIDNSDGRVFYGYQYIHRRKGSHSGMIGFRDRPQDKDWIHYSQIWEDEEMPEIEYESLFYVFLPGKQTPQIQYRLYSEAQKEAERLCKKEKQIAYVCEVRIIVEPSNEVKVTYR